MKTSWLVCGMVWVLLGTGMMSQQKSRYTVKSAEEGLKVYEAEAAVATITVEALCRQVKNMEAECRLNGPTWIATNPGRPVVYLEASVGRGHNIPHLIFAYDVKAQRATYLGEAFGSALADGLLDPTGRYLAIHMLSHMNGANGMSEVVIFDSVARKQTTVDGDLPEAKFNEKMQPVREISQVEWQQDGLHFTETITQFKKWEDEGQPRVVLVQAEVVYNPTTAEKTVTRK